MCTLKVELLPEYMLVDKMVLYFLNIAVVGAEYISSTMKQAINCVWLAMLLPL
jgi:hypothetical protein